MGQIALWVVIIGPDELLGGQKRAWRKSSFVFIPLYPRAPKVTVRPVYVLERSWADTERPPDTDAKISVVAHNLRKRDIVPSINTEADPDNPIPVPPSSVLKLM